MGVVRGKDRTEPDTCDVSFQLLKLTTEEAQSIPGQRGAWGPQALEGCSILDCWKFEVASRGDISHPHAMGWDLWDKEVENPLYGDGFGTWLVAQSAVGQQGGVSGTQRKEQKGPQCPVQETK